MSALRALPWALHMLIAYLAGIFLVVSPFVFEYTDSIALPVLLGAGMIVLATGVLGRGSLGVFGILPIGAQAVLDYATAFALMLAPFVFGFRDEATALLVSVMTGLGLLVVALLSRYPRPTPAPAPAATTPATPAALETARPERPERTEQPDEPDQVEHTAHSAGELDPNRDREPDPELPKWAQGSYQDDEEAGEADEDWRDDDGADAADRAAGEADADRRRG